MDTKNCKGCEIEFTYDSNIKSDKTKKFCTKQCCKKYYRSLSKQKSKKANGWVPNRKTRKEKQLIEKNIYLELNKTHLKIKDIEEKYNITFNAFEKFCKKYIGVTLEAIIVKVSFYNGHWGGGITKFYKQDIIPYIEKYTSNKIPDGFVDTSYIIEKLNICKITYWEYVKLFGSVEGKCLYLNRPIYPKPSADLWIEKIPVLRKELSESSNLKKKLEILERNKIKKQLQQEKTNKWKLEIQERRKRERKEIEARKLARSLIAKKQRYPNRQDDWTSWQNYESRLRARLSDTSELSKIRSQKSINANKHYHEQHDLGNIINLSCKRCNIQKPYYDFLFSQSIKIGRSQPCKECARKAANKNKNVNKLKDENQFSIQFIVSIKRELSKKNGCYYEIPAKKIWDALPYTKEQFLAHVKSLMQPWMTWENNTRPKIGQKTWHLDHIIPKVSFDYKSINDQAFIDCWSLSNLRPIEAEVNIIKSDHKNLNDIVCTIFKSAVIKNKKVRTWNKYFNYTPEEARGHLESQFIDGMYWSNFGKIWHIDHIVPKAALPYESYEDQNYIKLWSLSNLRPLFVSDNCSKGSKYNDKKHFTVKIS